MESGATPKPKRERRRLQSTNEKWWSRHSKCTPEMITQIESYLKKGLPVIHTCALVGLSEETYYGWLKRGREYLNSPKPNPRDEGYGVFCEMHHRAIAEWQLEVIERSMIGEKYKSIWVRDMTLLERRDPSNWGREDRNSGRGSVIDPDLRFL